MLYYDYICILIPQTNKIHGNAHVHISPPPVYPHVGLLDRVYISQKRPTSFTAVTEDEDKGRI